MSSQKDSFRGATSGGELGGSLGDSFTGQRGFRTLVKAIDDGRLPNSNLLICDSGTVCEAAINFIAKKILAVENLENCPDFMRIVPIGAMAQISVDQIRELRSRIYLSPRLCAKKIVVIFNGDRMHGAAANAFLKTLEEPPDDAVIFITAPRLHSLLPTIAGRCFLTRLSHGCMLNSDGHLKLWLANYSAWLAGLFDSVPGGKCDGSMIIMRMYLLLSQLEEMIVVLCDSAFSDDNSEGEAAVKRKICSMLLLEIENSTAEFFTENIGEVMFFHRAIADLERKAELYALNVNFMACIEAFLIEICQSVITFGG
jgi:hypothetical protein